MKFLFKYKILLKFSKNPLSCIFVKFPIKDKILLKFSKNPLSAIFVKFPIKDTFFRKFQNKTLHKLCNVKNLPTSVSLRASRHSPSSIYSYP